jgi:hypothetical protein
MKYLFFCEYREIPFELGKFHEAGFIVGVFFYIIKVFLKFMYFEKNHRV